MKTILVTGSSGLIGSESVKFPNNRMNNEFVGDVFDENENRDPKFYLEIY